MGGIPYPELRLVFCAQCDAAMTNTEERYHCPNSNMKPGGHCPSRPVDAQDLLRKVITQMVNRIATEETILHITKSIKDMNAENARIQHQILE